MFRVRTMSFSSGHWPQKRRARTLEPLCGTDATVPHNNVSRLNSGHPAGPGTSPFLLVPTRTSPDRRRVREVSSSRPWAGSQDPPGHPPGIACSPQPILGTSWSKKRLGPRDQRSPSRAPPWDRHGPGSRKDRARPGTASPAAAIRIPSQASSRQQGNRNAVRPPLVSCLSDGCSAPWPGLPLGATRLHSR